jgi:outer membrane protein assembly factor BamD (BamD/ComL family)
MLTKQKCFRIQLKLILVVFISSLFFSLTGFSMPLDEFERAKNIIKENPEESLEALNLIIKKYPSSEFAAEAKEFVKEYSNLQEKEKAIMSKDKQDAEDLFNLGLKYYDFFHRFPIPLEVGIYLEPAFDIFRQLIEEFPKSIYADNAEYYILQDKITYSFEGANSVDVPIIVKECEEFIKKYPESELAAEIQYNIGEYLVFYVYNDYPYFKINPFLENMELMTLRYPWKIFGTEPKRYLELSKQAYEKCSKDYPESEYAKKAIEKIKETEIKISEVKDSLNNHPKTEIDGKISYDKEIGTWILKKEQAEGNLKYLLAGEKVGSVSDYNSKEVKVSGILSPRIYGTGDSDWFVLYLTSID